MSEFQEKSFPGEDKAYRDARDRLLEAELELRSRLESVAAMRRGLPPGGLLKEDYVFEEQDALGGIAALQPLLAATALSSLFITSSSASSAMASKSLSSAVAAPLRASSGGGADLPSWVQA